MGLEPSVNRTAPDLATAREMQHGIRTIARKRGLSVRQVDLRNVAVPSTATPEAAATRGTVSEFLPCPVWQAMPGITGSPLKEPLHVTVVVAPLWIFQFWVQQVSGFG